MVFVDLFLEVIGDLLQLFIFLLDPIPEFLHFLIFLLLLAFLELIDLIQQLINLHLLADDLHLHLLILIGHQLEVLFQAIDLDGLVLYLALQFADPHLILVVYVSVLFLLLVGEVELRFEAEELPIVIIDDFLHFFSLLSHLHQVPFRHLPQLSGFAHLP